MFGKCRHTAAYNFTPPNLEVRNCKITSYLYRIVIRNILIFEFTSMFDNHSKVVSLNNSLIEEQNGEKGKKIQEELGMAAVHSSSTSKELKQKM